MGLSMQDRRRNRFARGQGPRTEDADIDDLLPLNFAKTAAF